jgi:threonine/homoserine/homoserine lactone efflux protein
LIGLFTTGLHPKTSILAITMGHQITLASGDQAKILGFALFSVLALLPVAFPLFLALFHPQAGPRMKEKCTALLEKHGRWVASIICIVFALLLWHDALKVMPR